MSAETTTTACAYDYAILRVVPRVEREEFINVGVIVSCPAQRFLEARIELDESRLLALAPGSDLATIRAHLQSIVLICTGGKAAGPIGQFTPRERFYWLTARRSTIIQSSAVHVGRCQDPNTLIEHLMQTMVHPISSDKGALSRIQSTLP
jgi:hypothetical protein